MIYLNNEEYKVKFYKNSGNGNEPVFEYVRKLAPEIKAIITDQNTLINFGEFLKEPSK